MPASDSALHPKVVPPARCCTYLARCSLPRQASVSAVSLVGGRTIAAPGASCYQYLAVRHSSFLQPPCICAHARSPISLVHRAPSISKDRLHHAPEDEPNDATLGSRACLFMASSRKWNILEALCSGDAMRCEGMGEAARMHYRGTPTPFHVLARTLVSRRSSQHYDRMTKRKARRYC